MLQAVQKRQIDSGLWVERGPFGRPITSRSEQICPATVRLRSINQRRMEIRGQIPKDVADYFILVPTLRCNINCSYCQVSRVAETAKGFDWTSETVSQVVDFITRQSRDKVTLEFQGGEPLLRLDLIKTLRSRLLSSGKAVKTVVCTNLQTVDEAAWKFLASPDVLVSSSFDGTWQAHDRLRTRDGNRLADFRKNLDRALRDLGQDRVSLVSTLDAMNPPEPEEIVKSVTDLGISNIFIRPVNYQGFARKAFSAARSDELWDAYYKRFLDYLIAENAKRDVVIAEYYFGYILRRILDPRCNDHVDLRNPSLLGQDYLVIGERGDIFPTDEARMLYRTGHVDLRIGHVTSGLNQDVISILNAQSDNRNDPECRACVYQGVCGRDLVDDLSRYGRIDGARHETRHCQRHLSIFDYSMRAIATADREQRDVLARMAGLNGLRTSAYRSLDV